MSQVREPAVAGRFYPGKPDALRAELARQMPPFPHPEPALAIVVPHAGYVYSGAIAGQVYAQVVVPDAAVVLCPNHTGLGNRRAVWPSGAWRIPGDEVPVDSELASALCENAGLTADALAHSREHAVEVHLPFLRARNVRLSVVPVCLGHLSLPESIALGEAMGQVLRDRGRDVLLVASTDFSHYLPAEEARDLDELAMARIEALDPQGLYQVVRDRDISMCGVIPTTVALAAARFLGGRSARRVRYGHSGEVSHDLDSVVGYGGFVVPKP